ncbi:MAG: hypothetical protein GEU74_05210 [Nitriliruptorales bacterium]|nr:hypothetical protein [Nitriliruptorales bacterium]
MQRVRRRDVYDVDVVYIATPNALHVDHALAAIAAGKHVLVDKPMALSMADGHAMVAAADRHGVNLGVGFQLRHKATNRTARDVIRTGGIGTPVCFELSIGAGKDHFPYDTWRSDPSLAGGGTLLNQGIHVIDLVQFLADSPIVEVSCFADAPPAEDVAVATCRLANGALVTLASNQVMGGTPRTWRAVGHAGWLEGVGAVGAAAGDDLVLHTGTDAEVLVRGSANAYDDEVDAFAAAVAKGVPVNGTGHDGVSVIAVVAALYRSADEGRAVTIG